MLGGNPLILLVQHAQEAHTMIWLATIEQTQNQNLLFMLKDLITPLLDLKKKKKKTQKS